MEIQHVICYAFSVDKDYKILRIMEMGCIDMMNKYAELICIAVTQDILYWFFISSTLSIAKAYNKVA